MAELKRLGRLISQPNAPDISASYQFSTNLGKLVEGAQGAVGHYVESNNIIAEKTVLGAATSKFEMDYIAYKNNPDITPENFNAFNENLGAQYDGFLSQAPRGREKNLESGLKQLQQTYLAKSYDDMLQQSAKNEKRDISLTINELQATYTAQVGSGDYGSALETRNNMAELIQALSDRGASAKDLIKISEDTEIMGLIAEGSAKLKNANSLEERTAIVQDFSQRPSSRINDSAFNGIYKQYNQFNKIYKEAQDLSEGWNNIATNQPWKNRDLSAGEADALVNGVRKNRASREGQESTDPIGSQTYQAFPAYKDQVKTFDFSEDIAAEREGREPRRYLVESAAATIQKPSVKAPDIFQAAEDHITVGAKNASTFPSMVQNSLYGGGGQEANDAVVALTHAYDKMPASIELDAETEMLYTEFKIAADSGRKDYDNIINEVRASVLGKARTNAEINTNIYNNKYGVAGKNVENLNKVFEKATGVNALKTGSTAALRDFNSILRSKFLLSDGRPDAAYEAARQEMGRSHGVDKFTNKRYISYPPSLLLQGQTEAQISNQFLTQLLSHSKKEAALKLKPAYHSIEQATDYDRANVDYSSFSTIPGLDGIFDSEIRVTQYIPEKGDVEGTFFVKPNILTTQNNLGIPVWEAWMADDKGNEYPIIDESSPVIAANNPNSKVLLVFGKPLAEFAPEYVKDKNDEDIKKIVNDVLEEEGAKLYGGKLLLPFTQAAKDKASYIKDLSNQKRVDRRVKKALGKESTSDE